MDNISSLKIAIDSSDAKKATNELGNLTNVSGKAEKTVNTLRNAFATIGAGALAKQFIDTADSLKLLDARLKLATDSTKEFKSQQEQLLKISLQSYTAYSDTVTLFTKLNPALKQVGASTEQVNSVVSSFVKGLQLGGSSAAEASSAILQFSQAMGSGVLRGEEFNAIAEASPKLMSYLAKGMGVAQGELRKMAENGELTASRVSNALLKVKDSIDKDFATLPVTVAKAMTNLSTATGQFIQDVDSATGATSAIAKQIENLSNTINSISPEELENLLDLIKNTGIALAGGYIAIKSFNQGLELYQQSVNKSNEITALNTKIQEANKLAIESGEKAVQLRILADKVAETGMINGEKATRAQISALNAEAKAAQLAAETNTSNSYALQSTAKGFNLAAVASNTFKMALSTIPFMVIVTGLTAIATAISATSKSAQTLSDTLNMPIEKLKELTKNQLAYRKSVLETAIAEQKWEVRKKEMRAGANGLFDTPQSKKEQLAALDDEKQKLKDMQFAYEDIVDVANSYNKTVSKGTDSNLKTKRNEIEIIKILGSEYQKFNLTLDEQSKKLKEQGATEKEINDFRAEELKKFNEKQSDSSKKTSDEQKKLNDEAKKRAEDLSKAYLDISQVGMSAYDKALVSISEKVKEWIEAGVKENDVLEKQKQLLEELNLTRSLDDASEELSFLEKKAQLMTDEYEKAKLLLEIKTAQNMIDIQKQNLEPEDKQKLIDQENELYELSKQRLELNRDTEFQETMINFQDDMIERQRELNNALYEFGDTYEGIGGKISKVGKSVASFANAEIKAKKERESIDKKYEKEFTKYAGDVEKTKELEQKYSEETAQTNQMAIANQIEGYSNLAGAIAGLYEEGSSQAKTFMIIQKALSVVSGITAIAAAMANGDGYTAVARGLAVAATLASFGWSGSGGGSDASKGGEKKPTQFEIKEKEIEDLYTPMTDRLDRQIELLESINKQGSASALSLEGSKINFDRDYALAVNSILKSLPNDVRGYGLDFNNSLAGAESRLGFNIADVVRIKKSGWDKSEKRIYTDFGALSSGNNMIKLLADYFQTGDGAISALFGGNNALNQAANSIQKVIGDFTSEIVDSLDDLKDASQEFKDIYDGITGTMFFENKRLLQAYEDVEKLSNGKNLATYLKENIDQIDFLNETFNESVVNTLLSQDPKDIEEQVKVLEELKVATGLVFENGARDALDFLESIKLVGDAMVTSTENTRDFLDSFLNDTQRLEVMASKLGVDIPKSMEELMTAFTSLSTDIMGLTNEELEYLNSSKVFLENKNEELLQLEEELLQLEIDKAEAEKKLQEDLLSNIKSNINLLGNILGSLKNKVDELRNSADSTNTYGINKFYESMDKTLELMKGKDYKAIEESLKSTIGYSNALTDSKNFALSRDMRYAQLVAANQFESMDVTLKDELDYLKLIEQNTSNTVDLLTATLKNMGTQISGAVDGLTEQMKAEADAKEFEKLAKKMEAEQSVINAYTNVLGGITPTDNAIKIFSERLLSGEISNIAETIAKEAIINNFQTDFAKAYLNSIGLPSFAVGTTNVSNDMTARIHQGEIITPKNFSDGLRNGDLVMGQTSNMINAINSMGSMVGQKVSNLENKLNDIISIAGTQIIKLDDIYNASNGSLVSLQNIEGII